MTNIELIKLQAKNFYKDFKTRYLTEEGYYDYKPQFFNDIYEIIEEWQVDVNNFSLMKAQHLLAQILGFKSWADLIHSSDEKLEIAKSLLEHKEDNFNGYPFIQSWLDYEEEYLNELDDYSKLLIYKHTFLNEKL